MDNTHKIRILHVVYCMDPGGIENWLMNILRVTNRDIFHMDFLFHTKKISAYDEEILALGSNILRCPWSKNPLLYSRNFKIIIKKHGPYNVIHSHVHHFSGWILRAAYQAGIKIRIAHSHNNINDLISRENWIRKAYYFYMKYLIKRYASVGIAASIQSAKSLFGPKWENTNRWQLIQYGINVNPFQMSVDKNALRRKLGITDDSLVVGHVGRFCEQKNHPFIIDIFSEIIRKDPFVRLILIGDGQQFSTIKKLSKKKGVYKNIIFTGSSSNVAELMLGAMDVFIFPSLWEGLGIVIVEAQAAGLPCILSERIPHEAEIVSSLIYRIPLSKSAKEWAEIIFDVHKMKKKKIPSQKKSLQMVLNSPFNFKKGQLKLESIYNEK
mgnify:CR=1 FL=1